jgi:hypothetical protein
MPKLEISKVHDAYAGGAGSWGVCPLCGLIRAAERNYLHTFQGSRVMEPTARVRTNERGFCKEHYLKLYGGDNKLGLGLMVHTHLQEWLPRLNAAMEAALKPDDASGKKKAGTGGVKALAETLEALRDGCAVCDMLHADLERYIETILYLWKEDPQFPETFRGSRGFCLEHFRAVALKADAYYKETDRLRFLGELVPMMKDSLKSLERDLFDFTQLFQDANKSLGTEETRTALLRAVQILAGCAIG